MLSGDDKRYVIKAGWRGPERIIRHVATMVISTSSMQSVMAASWTACKENNVLVATAAKTTC